MKTLVLFIFAMAWALLSGCSPDKSGVIERCAKEFQVPALNTFKLEVVFREEGAFKSPKYHLRLKDGDIGKLKNELITSGFNDWEKGELSFDGISFGWREDDLEYSQLKRNGSTYYAAVSVKFNEVVFVRYP